MSVREKLEQCYKTNVDSILVNLVFPVLTSSLEKEKSVNVTVEEMMKWLEIEHVEQTVTSNTARTSTRRRKKTARVLSDVPIEGKCHHKISRGKNEGKYCPNNSVDGTEFCKSHKGKSKAQPNKKKSTKKAPEKSTGLVTKSKEIPDELVLHVNPFHKNEEYLHDPNTNFVIIDDGEVIKVIAKEEEDGEVRKLTEAEKLEAEKLDLVAFKNEEKEEEEFKLMKSIVFGEENDDERKDQVHHSPEKENNVPEEGTSESPGVVKHSPKEKEKKTSPKPPKNDAGNIDVSNVTIPILPEIPDVPTIG